MFDKQKLSEGEEEYSEDLYEEIYDEAYDGACDDRHDEIYEESDNDKCITITPMLIRKPSVKTKYTSCKIKKAQSLS